MADGTLDGEDVSTVFAEKQQIIRKSGILEYQEAPSGLDAVGGLDELKDWLKRRNAAFSKRAREFGLPSPRGALLVGVHDFTQFSNITHVGRERNPVKHVWRLDVQRLSQHTLRFEARMQRGTVHAARRAAALRTRWRGTST